MSLDKLSKILKNKTLIPKKIQNASYICWQAENVIKKFSDDFKIISYKNKVLKIGVSSNCAANNLKMKEQIIIDQINKKLAEKTINKISTKVL